MQSYTILLSMQHNNTDPLYIHIYKNIDTGSYQSPTCKNLNFCSAKTYMQCPSLPLQLEEFK